jgi:hypothetical protein
LTGTVWPACTVMLAGSTTSRATRGAAGCCWAARRAGPPAGSASAARATVEAAMALTNRGADVTFMGFPFENLALVLGCF